MNRSHVGAVLTLVVGLAIGDIYGSVFQTHASAASLTPCKKVVAPSHPAPSASHRVLVTVQGSDNKQTANFHASGAFTISWHTALQDTSMGSGFISMELDSAQGDELDLVLNTTKPTRDSTIEHADCSHGCYFKISEVNMKYFVQATQ